MPRPVACSLIVLLGLGVACAGGAPRAADSGPSSSDVAVQVISHNMRDVVVYISVGRSRLRLGLAGGNRTTIFKVPWSQLGRANSGIQLVADQVGDQTQAVSEDVQLRPGDLVVWTLEPYLDRSSITVF